QRTEGDGNSKRSDSRLSSSQVGSSGIDSRVGDLPGIAESKLLELPILLGNPYLSPETIIARWAAAIRARDIVLAPSALASGSVWTVDTFNPDYGLSLVVGNSGSGKTNAILAMAFSMAFSLPPEFLRFLILDPDRFRSLGALEDIGA